MIDERIMGHIAIVAMLAGILTIFIINLSPYLLIKEGKKGTNEVLTGKEVISNVLLELEGDYKVVESYRGTLKLDEKYLVYINSDKNIAVIEGITLMTDIKKDGKTRRVIMTE